MKLLNGGIHQSSYHGHIKLNHSQFLGYGRDENGNLVIIEEEAKNGATYL